MKLARPHRLWIVYMQYRMIVNYLFISYLCKIVVQRELWLFPSLECSHKK